VTTQDQVTDIHNKVCGHLQFRNGCVDLDQSFTVWSLLL